MPDTGEVVAISDDGTIFPLTEEQVRTLYTDLANTFTGTKPQGWQEVVNRINEDQET